LAIIVGSLPNQAAAGGASQGVQPPLRGSYCDGSDQELAPPAGCPRISGYVTAGDRFGFDEKIGGDSDLFAPRNQSRDAGARSSSGLTIIGAPFGGDRFPLSASPGDMAR
jgi:hypothetical protein